MVGRFEDALDEAYFILANKMLAVLLAISLPAEPTVAIQHVTVIHPGVKNAVPDQTVVFRGDRILTVGPSARASIPKDAEIVDGRGKFLMPGLWDMHVHLMTSNALGLFSANGVTGIRVMFGAPRHLTWKKQIEKGEMAGPRIVAGSPIVDGAKPVWAGSIAAATAEAGREAVRTIKKDGYDFVKVYSLLSREAYFAIADECKKQKIPFEGHVPHAISELEAIKAGQRTFEHVLNVSLDSSSREEEFRKEIASVVNEGFPALIAAYKKISAEITKSSDSKKLEALISELARTKTHQCPTLIVLRNTAYLDQLDTKKDDRLKYLPAFLTATWAPDKDMRFKDRKPEDWAAAKRVYAGTEQVVSLMHKAGVPILAGSDCYNPMTFPGFSLHDELGLLVKIGMTPTEALASATTVPARFYGLEKVSGKIAPGCRADLVLLTANPLQDIGNTKKIAAVVQRGKLLDRKALDELLKSLEFGR